MIGIYKTESEYLARVVLDLVTDQGHDVRFTYKDGWYEVWVLSPILKQDAHAYNVMARGLQKLVSWAYCPRPLAEFAEAVLP